MDALNYGRVSVIYPVRFRLLGIELHILLAEALCLLAECVTLCGQNNALADPGDCSGPANLKVGRASLILVSPGCFSQASGHSGPTKG